MLTRSAVFFTCTHWVKATTPFPDKQTIVGVAVMFLNTAAILSLFWLIFKHEKNTAAKFGKAIRDNLSTIIVALMINFVNAVYELFQKFL